MIPNPDIWGAPSSWEAGSSLRDWGKTNAIIDGKFAVFDTSKNNDDIARYSINSGITANKLIRGEPFDTSCCPWRIKGDSYWISGRKKLFLPMHGDDTAIQLYTDDVISRGCPVMISTYPSTANNHYPKLTNINKIWTPAPAGAGITTDIETTPLLKFDYSKILLRCFVAACRYYDDTDSSIFSVDNYYENKVSTHPYIRALVFDVYVNNNGTWQQLDYSEFNIIPVNATIAGFEAESITAFNDDFSVISDGFNGNTVGGINQTGIIRYYSNERGDTESECFYNSYSRNTSIRYAAAPDDWTNYTRVSSGNFYFSMYKQNVPKEWVMQQFAALGFWFYTGGAPAVDLSAPDEHTHIPLFDDYGTTTGDYLSGTAALTAPAAEWTDDVFERDIYHGEPPYDPTHYDPDNTTVFPSIGAWTISEGFYGIPYEQMQPALQYLYTWAQSQQEIDSIKEFLVTDPIEVVHSLTIFPINIVPDSLTPPYDIYNAIFPTAPIVNIQFGNVVSTIQAFNIPYRSGIIDMGYIDVFETFRNFLDYSPYTSLMIYLPFCGFQALDCDKYMGHKINIKYVVDFATGSCTALLLRDNLVCDTVNGQMGVTVSLTGLRASQVQSAVDSAMLQYKQRSREAAVGLASLTAGAAGAALSGNPLALGGSILGAANLAAKFASADENLEYNLSHIHTPFATVGASTSAISGNMELTPRLYISRPMMISSYDPSIYAHTIGYSCLLNVQLSEVEGFTRCASADLSGIPATAQEKQLLLKLLQSGIYM